MTEIAQIILASACGLTMVVSAIGFVVVGMRRPHTSVRGTGDASATDGGQANTGVLRRDT